MQQQRLLAAEELGAVVGQRLELGRQARPGAPPAVGDLRRRELAALGHDVVADSTGPADAPGPPPPSPDQRVTPPAPSRSTMRIPASARTWGPRFGYRPEIIDVAVQHGDDPGVDQGLGGRPVEVDLVEHGDVAGAAAARAGPGTAIGPGGAGHAGQAVGTDVS